VPDDAEVGILHDLPGPVEYVPQGLRDIGVGRHVNDPVKQGHEGVVSLRVQADIFEVLSQIVEQFHACIVGEHRRQVFVQVILNVTSVLSEKRVVCLKIDKRNNER